MSDRDSILETITTQNPYAAEVLAEFWNGAERVGRGRGLLLAPTSIVTPAESGAQ